MPTCPRALVLCALAAISAPVAGCDSWPLHAALPDPVERADSTPEQLAANDDPSAQPGELQDLGAMPSRAILTVRGGLDACGWDGEAAWPQWPDHSEDDDGDGILDRTGPRHRGWYAGDIDVFQLRPAAGSAITASLSWANAPEGGQNAVYQPAADGPWSVESDLDVLAFSTRDGALDAVLAEGGFTRSHPEDTGAPLLIEGAGDLALAVACHHGVGSGYVLTVTITPR